MEVESAHADEAGPARRVGEGRIVTVEECHLGRTQRENGIPLGQERVMKSDEKAPADRVIDVPKAGDDVRNTRGQERMAEADGTLDA